MLKFISTGETGLGRGGGGGEAGLEGEAQRGAHGLTAPAAPVMSKMGIHYDTEKKPSWAAA